jgi:hypothetical protein
MPRSIRSDGRHSSVNAGLLAVSCIAWLGFTVALSTAVRRVPIHHLICVFESNAWRRGSRGSCVPVVALYCT